MVKVNWLVDELLSERAYETGYPSIAEVAVERGHGVYKTRYVPFSSDLDDNIPFPEHSCVVTHGTVQFCKQVERKYGRSWCPAMYFNSNVKLFSKFAAYIGADLLNSDFYILPYGEFIRRKSCCGESFFIKPESGLKEFVGQVIHEDSFEDDLSKLSPYNKIDPDCLCVISTPKEILAEFRYIICNKEVITGSEYRWHDVLDVRRDTHPVCDAMAKKIAEADWQADTVYVCDVALLVGGVAKVIELNAFSSSGLYACDTYKIVDAVSKAAEMEYSG